MKYQLTSLNTEPEASYNLEDFVCLGSEKSNHIVLAGKGVEERHARLECKDSVFTLKDLRSEYGTFVNDKRILETFLNPGDIIRIGCFEFVFEDTEVETALSHLSSRNEVWNDVVTRLPTYAKSDLPILILGESGCGKELVSKALHQLSRRRYKPSSTVNCSALTTSLAESELFGHIRGSYTGATQDRRGAFEAARGGTLILDEVGDLPLELQPKLLRAIENREIKPVGSDRIIKTDCRIIACTHHDLHEKVIRGEFRLDLFFRLNVVQVRIPALRERREDFDRILFEFARELRVKFSVEAVEYLRIQRWPGNIRELKNLVSRCRIYHPNEYITRAQVETLMEKQEHIHPLRPTDKKLGLMKNLEKELIISRLLANRGNQRLTSIELGIPKSTLFDRIKFFGIDVKELTHRNAIKA